MEGLLWGCGSAGLGTVELPRHSPGATAGAIGCGCSAVSDSREQQGKGKQLVVARDVSPTAEPPSGLARHSHAGVPWELPWGHLCDQQMLVMAGGEREETPPLLSSQSRAWIARPAVCVLGSQRGCTGGSRCLPSPWLPAWTSLRRGLLALAVPGLVALSPARSTFESPCLEPGSGVGEDGQITSSWSWLPAHVVGLVGHRKP